MSLSTVYKSVPSSAASEWQLALHSVLYGDELLADGAEPYGKQQNNRNHWNKGEYVQSNGDRITEFAALTVAEPRAEDKGLLPAGAMVPVAPESGEVLPVMVSEDGVDEAISLLAEFPVEPAADEAGVGATALLDPGRVQAARVATGTQTETVSASTVLFVSDTHAGFENRVVTGRGDSVPWMNELSSTETFHRIREIAIAQDVDAVVHTGDVLDHEVDRETLDAIGLDLAMLAASDIPVYGIIGSHDHDSYEPRHSGSVDGIAWLQKQTSNGNLTELSAQPTGVPDSPLTLYGISAGNVGIDAVGTYQSRSWTPADISFTPGSRGWNVLCLHDGFGPYRTARADVDLDELLAQAAVSFDCVLIGDEHRPENGDFDTGYTFESRDGTPVLYTGPAMRISDAYSDHAAFVTELTISSSGVSTVRHTV
ncbi:metallophosphoesterase [Haloarcula laminariae]|uniref:metallophosphoesterase n=1 Tax=Haloarcula laminariae TaxID=2961577 RepID=UPI0021C7D735